MPDNQPLQQPVRRRQPSGGYPQGAVAFLLALLEPSSSRLSAWLAAHQLDDAAIGWLKGQELASYAFYRLQSVRLDARLPAEIRAFLRGAFYSAVGDSVLHAQELKAALQALGVAGITPVLFKGAVLAHTVYPDPACRPMGDLDLWVTHEEMARAQVALEDLGYVQHTKATRPIELQARRSGELQLVGRCDGSGLIELHWGVFAGEWLERTAAVDESAIRARTAPIVVVGHKALTLAPEDALIQLAVHLAINHQFGQPHLRALLDVALLSRAQPIDWLSLADRARTWRVGTVVWTVLHLTADLLGLSEARPATAALTPSLLRRGLLWLFVSPESLLTMRDLHGGPLRFGLQLLLVDRVRDAVHLLWRALWPEDAWLTLRYGTATPGVRWRHLLGAIRGRT